MLARSGNIGWFSSSGPNLGEIVRRDVVDPEDRVRVAHVHHRRRMQDRLVDRPDLQFDRARVAEFLGERNLVPAKPRRAHVDGVAARRRPSSNSTARPRSRSSAHPCRSACSPVRRRSACRCRRRPPPSRRCCRCARRRRCRPAPDRAPSTGRRARAFAAARASSALIAAGCAAHVDDDDLVAETVHLHEAEIRQRAHNAARLCATYMGK